MEEELNMSVFFMDEYHVEISKHQRSLQAMLKEFDLSITITHDASYGLSDRSDEIIARRHRY